jgi:hypothetical protein
LYLCRELKCYMRKSGFKIFSLLLASVFLLSFTGLRLLSHYCNGCETEDISLFTEIHTCSTHHAQQESVHCCEMEIPKDTCCIENQPIPCSNCCSEQVIYVKHKYEVVTYSEQLRLLPVEVNFPSIIYQHLWGMEDTDDEVSFGIYSAQPPLRIVGKEFVVYSHQLKLS